MTPTHYVNIFFKNLTEKWSENQNYNGKKPNAAN